MMTRPATFYTENCLTINRSIQQKKKSLLIEKTTLSMVLHALSPLIFLGALSGRVYRNEETGA